MTKMNSLITSISVFNKKAAEEYFKLFSSLVLELCFDLQEIEP